MVASLILGEIALVAFSLLVGFLWKLWKLIDALGTMHDALGRRVSAVEEATSKFGDTSIRAELSELRDTVSALVAKQALTRR